MRHAVEDLGFKLPEDEIYLWYAKQSWEAEIPEFWEECTSVEGERFFFNRQASTKSEEKPQTILWRHLFNQKKRREKAYVIPSFLLCGIRVFWALHVTPGDQVCVLGRAIQR